MFYTFHFFEKVIKDDGTVAAKCLMCLEKNNRNEVFLKVTDGNTKGLNGHIESQHKEYAKKWREIKAANDEKRKSAPGKRKKASDEASKQLKLVGHGENKTLQIQSRNDPDLQRRFDKARVLFVAKSLSSFNIMKHDHILVKALLPQSHSKIKFKTPETISNHTTKLADELRRDMLSIIISAKDTTKSFGFSSDLSKTKNCYSLISLTIHFPTPDGELFELALHADYFGTNRHTGSNILFSLQSFMEECKLDGDDITRYMVLDNASNNKKAIRLGTGSFNPVWCACHTIQLSIKDALKVKLGMVSINRVLDKCRDVCRLVRRSETNRDALKQACQINEETFILPKKPINIRWNSIDDMVASILRIQEGLTYMSFRDRGTWSEAVPENREFEVAGAVHKCLKPLKIATKVWEKSKEPNLHEVVKQLWNIKCALEEERRASRYTKMFAGHLQKMVEKRFKDCGTRVEVFAIAQLLDPDMRGLVLKEFPGVYEKTIADMRRRCLKYDNNPVHIREEPADDAGDGDGDQNLTGAEKLKKRRIARDHEDNLPAVSRFDLDIQKYEQFADADKDYSNPLKWFIRNKGTYPILSQLSEEIHPVPASSASSERVFSSATRVSQNIFLSPISFN